MFIVPSVLHFCPLHSVSWVVYATGVHCGRGDSGTWCLYHDHVAVYMIIQKDCVSMLHISQSRMLGIYASLCSTLPSLPCLDIHGQNGTLYLYFSHLCLVYLYIIWSPCRCWDQFWKHQYPHFHPLNIAHIQVSNSSSSLYWNLHIVHCADCTVLYKLWSWMYHNSPKPNWSHNYHTCDATCLSPFYFSIVPNHTYYSIL